MMTVEHYGVLPIERSARWDETAVLPSVSQRLKRPGGLCCPHCGSKEFRGGTIDVLIRELYRQHFGKSGQAKLSFTPSCVICDHNWTLTLVRMPGVGTSEVQPIDSDFAEWRYKGLEPGFEPLRVLARYYQSLKNR